MRQGDVVPLPPKAVDTLLALVANRGRILTKDQLMKLVWPDTFVEEGGLARNISQLRKVLNETAAGDPFIETIPKRGYRFTAPVREVAAGESPAESVERLALAVFPLKDLSSDPAQQPFCEGMNEALITNLAKIGGLRVYQGDANGLSELSSVGGLETAVEGACLLAGERVRITVRLIRAKTREHLWAESYEGDLRDIVELQGHVARDVARHVQVRVTPQEHERLARAQPVDPEAYQAYLEGRFWWNRRTVEALHRAIECFHLATVRDPGDARAYAGLADTHALLGSTPYNARPPQELFPKAADFARRAVEIDSGLAEARTSLAYVKLAFEWDAQEAERDFRAAIDLNPGYATARHWHGHSLMALGRLDEALVEFTRAQELDLHSPVIASSIGWCHYYAGNYDRAIEQYQGILLRDPNYVLVMASLGMVYAQSGRVAASIAMFQRALDVTPDSISVWAALGYAHAISGDAHAARGIIDKLDTYSREHYVPAMLRAVIHTGLKETDVAMQWLQKARDERSDYVNYLHVDPAFSGLRSHAGFPGVR